MAKGSPEFVDGDKFRNRVEHPKMNPDEFYGYLPYAPHHLTERQTPIKNVFSLNHFGVPIVDASEWRLDIGGLVDKPQILKLDDVKSLPKHAVSSMHQCAGSPLDPTAPKRRISNVEWAGAKLSDLLREIGVNEEAEYMWSYGPDGGVFSGYPQDFYLKDLPLTRAFQDDVLLAYELNGELLPNRNGFPVRLFVPGFYGTNCVKWICQMVFAKERADSLFTTNLYSDTIKLPGDDAIVSKPVWDIAPESIIVSPRAEEHLEEDEQTIWGWAWGATEISGVDVSTDGGESWQPAILEKRSGWSWQRYEMKWRPRAKGQFSIISRARNFDGHIQPMDGSRNAVHTLRVEVV